MFLLAKATMAPVTVLFVKFFLMPIRQYFPIALYGMSVHIDCAFM